MQIERDKENTIRNSKLQMSIKPFNVLREDLSKSKSVDKARKGISRVNSAATNSGNTLAFHPSSQNFYSSLTIQPHSTHTQEPAHQQNLNMNMETKMHDRDKKIQSDLRFRIQLLEKELVVIQKQNIEILRERNQWKQKCGQLCQVNQRLQDKLHEVNEKLNILSQLSKQMQQQLGQKQKQINEMMSGCHISKQTVQSSNEHVAQMARELMQAKQKVIQLKQQQDVQREREYKEIEQAKWTSKQFRILKEQKSQLEESYRQLLIKSSSATNEILALQSKVRSLSHQLSSEQEQSSKMQQNYRMLEQDFVVLQQQAVLGRACRKQLEQIDQIRMQNAELLRQNKQYEGRMKELQQKRLNQIEFHQQEIRRICSSEAAKYQNLIEIYKKQRNEAEKEMNSVKIFYQNAEHNQKALIGSISADYECIVVELKEKLTTLAAEKEELLMQQIHGHKKQLQISELIQKLNTVKEDNAFLLLKLEEQQKGKNKTIMQLQNLRRSRERADTPSQETLSLLQKELKQLQQSNRKAEIKLSEYEVEFMKLSDKIHMYQIDAENAKGRETSLQRKIKHLIEEIQHLKEEKSKEIAEKIKLVQELQNMKLFHKNRDIEYRGMQQTLNQSTTKLELLQAKLANAEQALEEKSTKLNHLAPQVQVLKQQLDMRQSKIEQISSLYQQTINSLNQLLQKQKYSRKLAEDENNLAQQKLLTKYSTHQQEQTYAKEKRFTIYRQLFITLGTEADIKPGDQSQILTRLSKGFRNFVQGKMEMESRMGKIQAQYKQLIQTEDATRMLAQKYQQKCVQLENLLITMEQAHKEKLVLVKQDYDIVYGKYMKYRSMVVLQNKERSKEKGLRR